MKPVSVSRTLMSAAIAATLLLAGCSSLPPLKHVMLTPPQTQRLAARPSDWKVRRVQMPEYLDNYDIQLRTANYVLTQLPNARWAERLPVATTRLLQQTINEKLQNNRDKHYEVHVDVDTFEPQPSGQVVLAASWRVTNASGAVVAHDDALIKEPLSTAQTEADHPSAGEIGEAMSTAVRELAMRIVAHAG